MKNNSLNNSLGKVSKKKEKKKMDLSNAHLTPASQAERWIKKIRKFQIFLYCLYNHQIWREL